MADKKKQMVKVELDFLNDVEYILKSLDLKNENIDSSIKVISENIIYEIELKKKKLNARKEFAKIKYSEGEDKENAIIDYLRAKNEVNNF